MGEDPHFLSDAEIAKRLNLGDKTFAIAARQRGFPMKDPRYGNKRYWPAVRSFIDRQQGATLSTSPHQPLDGPEDFSHARKDTKHPRPAMAGSR